jgi:hypothetical protein
MRQVTVALVLPACFSWAELSETRIRGTRIARRISASGKSKYFRVMPLFAQKDKQLQGSIAVKSAKYTITTKE